MTKTAAAVQNVVGSFGRLWGRGHEILQRQRRILRVSGPGATHYLQNLVTCHLQQPPVPPRPEPLESATPGVPSFEKNSSNNSDAAAAAQQSEASSEESPMMAEFSDALRAACFLDAKGRIVSDSLLWKVREGGDSSTNGDDDSTKDNDSCYYLVDAPASAGDALWEHLQQYQTRRSRVTLRDTTAETQAAVVFGTLSTAGSPPGYVTALDPRHPSLGLRVLRLPPRQPPKDDGDDNIKNTNSDTEEPSLTDQMKAVFPESPGNYEVVRRLAGVAEGAELSGRVALECNQEHLNAVSFDKGCYLGQELTARVHHTGVLRKRVMPIFLLDPYTEIPRPWIMAAQLQEGRAQRRFTASELAALPSRLPRLSVWSAGNLVAATTASIEPTEPAADEEAAAEYQAAQAKAAQWLAELEECCVPGAKLVDDPSGKTIGQIVAAPVKGTNVALALMRLESVGLLKGGVWSKTNKVQLVWPSSSSDDDDDGDKDNDENTTIKSKKFRYLPYVPLWWPELDMETGKAKAVPPDGESGEFDCGDEARGEDEEMPRGGENSASAAGAAVPDDAVRVRLDTSPLTEQERQTLLAQEEAAKHAAKRKSDGG